MIHDQLLVKHPVSDMWTKNIMVTLLEVFTVTQRGMLKSSENVISNLIHNVKLNVKVHF